MKKPNKLKKTWKYLTSEKSKKKYKKGASSLKKGLVKASAYFQATSNALDETVGIDKRKADYRLI